MLQRVQSIYLLIAVILLVFSLCLPIGEFIGENGSLVGIFKPNGIFQPGDICHNTWGLFTLLALAAAITLCTIFLFRNRILQIRITIFNTILLIGYYIVLVIFVQKLKNEFVAFFQLDFALCLPAIAIILNYLAIRAIHHDELLVKASDRLR